MKNLCFEALAALVLVSAACAPSPVQAPPLQPAVTTAPATTRAIEHRLPFVGRAENARPVTLRALVDGRVTRVLAADGARIETGNEVFTLGGPRVTSRLKSLVAAVEAAARSKEANQMAVEQAQRRQAAHLAAPGEVARTERDAASGEAALAAAQADFDRYEAALSVDAPVTGHFTDRLVSSGQEVLAGEPLGVILALEAIRITADVIPRPGLEPAPGQDAEVVVLGGVSLQTLVQAVQAATGAAGMVRVWLVGDGLRNISPGTVVRGFIVASRRQAAVAIPPDAVVFDREGRPLVYVGENFPYECRSVQLGERGPDWVEVNLGVRPGEQVVTNGAYELYWSEFSKEFKIED